MLNAFDDARLGVYSSLVLDLQLSLAGDVSAVFLKEDE